MPGIILGPEHTGVSKTDNSYPQKVNILAGGGHSINEREKQQGRQIEKRKKMVCNFDWGSQRTSLW